MRYLIDTNVLIRSQTDPSLLKDVLQIIENYENRIYVSAVSIQEIYMLMQNGKLHVKSWKHAQDVFNTIEEELGFTVDYVKKEHLLTFAGLEPVKGHADPSDRMIIAQAITEKIPLISSDAKFKHYCRQNLDFIFNNA
ncbi:MAG: type II toxin-antitoxin system VapC family toxin [Prevotellaceae bacterium]|jgi:PIN domain nuclease of toxin-antitoxin system|nr:type II toxin-antitoxin system VapC family toxin [Prevotellaceae bacterium]